MPTTSDDRLNRLEEKVDDVFEIMIAMARTEEKLSNLEQANARLFKRVEKLEEGQKKLSEEASQISSQTSLLVKIIAGIAIVIVAESFAAWFTIGVTP
jgi:hypothetical protein